MANDEIANSLGLDPIDVTELETQIVPSKPALAPSLVSVNKADQSDRDFQYARDNFYNVIENGTKALEEMMDLAKASEHPRAYEVVSTLMKTLVDANKDLVSMSEKKAEEQKAEEGGNSQQVTNNNLFVGSTAELQQMIKDMRDNESSDG
jgi:hypothetical protein